MAIDLRIQAELNDVITRLRRLSPEVRRPAKKDLMEAARVLERAVKGRTPVSDKPHRRYARRKGAKAAKGAGKPVATYRPGNLRRAMQRLSFRRSEAAFVGPKLNGSPDGYYAHFVEFGTINQAAQNFVASAVAAAGSTTLRLAAELIKQRIESFAKSNGLK